MRILHRPDTGSKNSPIYLLLHKGGIRLVGSWHPVTSHRRKSMRIFAGAVSVDGLLLMEPGADLTGERLLVPRSDRLPSSIDRSCSKMEF